MPGTSYFNDASFCWSARTSGPDDPTRRPIGAGAGGVVVVVVVVLDELLETDLAGFGLGFDCGEEVPLHDSATHPRTATSASDRDRVN
jgi:hypothetical protein